MDFGDSKTVRINDVEIDLQSQSVRRNGAPLPLRPKSLALLVYLIERRGQIVAKDELLEKLWRDSNGAEETLTQCILELRRTLGDDLRSPRCIRTVSNSGYQLAPESPAVQKRSSRPWIWCAAAAVVVVAAVLWIWRARPPAPPPLPSDGSAAQVLVLYFENQSRAADIDWLREGLADMLISDLSREPNIHVFSRDQLAALARRAGWNPQNPPRMEVALAMSNHARAQTLLLGKYSRSGDEIQITVQLIRARDGSLLRRETASVRRTDQIIGEVSEIASRLARYLGGQTKTPGEPASMAMTSNLEAYRSYSMGMQHVAVLQLAEGVQLLERAVELDPQFAAAHAALGSAYVVSWGRAAEGKPYLEKAVALSDRLTERQRMYVKAWFALADMEYPKAIDRFREIVTKYPGEAEAFCNLGRLLEGEGRYDEAIETEKRGLAADPDDPLLHNFLARVYCRKGNFDLAVTESKRYVELTNGEANAYDSLGTTYAWQGKYTDAEAAYKEALRRSPDFDIALVHMAGLYYRLGRYRDAIAELRQYLRFAPGDIDQARGNAWLAWIYLRRGDVAKSREAVAKEEPMSGPLLFMGRAMLALKSGDLAGARKIIDSAGTVPERGNRGSDRYRPYLRGMLALAAGKGDEGIAEFKRVLEQPEPVGFVDWFEDCLADGYLKLGRLDEAISEYQRVLGRNPNSALARYHLAEACARKGDKDLAVEEYQQFLDLWKDADSDLPEVRIARAAVSR